MTGEYFTCGTIWKCWSNSSATSTDTIWTPWCDSTDTATTYTCNDSLTVWGEWCNGTMTWSIHRPESPAISDAERERRAEAARVAAALKAKAERQAEMLLKELLNPRQRVEYDREKKFYVVTESGTRYEVDCQKRMHNIHQLDEHGRRIVEHCIYQDGGLPMGDNAAAQLLLLRADEKEFQRIANQRRLTG